MYIILQVLVDWTQRLVSNKRTELEHSIAYIGIVIKKLDITVPKRKLLQRATQSIAHENRLDGSMEILISAIPVLPYMHLRQGIIYPLVTFPVQMLHSI
jgi:hypothetical protein